MSFVRLAALLAASATVLSSTAFAGDVTVGVALGANFSAGQASPDIASTADGEEVGLQGPGGSGEVVVRRSLSDWSTLRAGLRGGYNQNRAVFEVGNEVRALPGSAGFLGALVGGEVHTAPPDSMHPYFLGELGLSGALLWPRTREGSFNDTTCAVSPNCDPTGDGSGNAGTDPETTRLAFGPSAVVGIGLSLDSAPVRAELSYVWTSLLGSTWSYQDVAGPGTSISMLELSVGYVFGG